MRYIKIFQQEYGLKPDGVIGNNTLKKISEVLGIKSKEHLAHFLGQVHLETGGFHFGRESMDYTPQALLKRFKGRITEKEAWKFGRTSNQPADQKNIANIVYGGEWGKKILGNTSPMDGWLYRGNGAIQLTGRHNHQEFANYIQLPTLMQNPDLVMQRYYFQSGVFFFNKRKLWRYCNEVTKEAVTKVSKAVNLGNPNHPKDPNHLTERIHFTFHYYTLLQNVDL